MKPLVLRGCWLALLLLATAPAPGQTIDLRLSVKIIVHPSSGARPAGVTPQMFTNAVYAANQWMASYWRGYRYQLTEVMDIGGPAQGGSNGPSKWFGRDPRNTGDGTWQSFQADVQGSSLYLLRTNILNYYVSTPTDWNTGGAAPFPWEAPAWIAAWGIVNDGPFWVVHECGHFYGLVHTHGGCGCLDTGGCSLLNGYWVGDDGLTDTLKEAAGDSCFTNINQLTLANFNNYFTNCTLAEQTLAMNTFSNVMSYHDPPNKDTLINRMTEQQADLLTTYANSDRAATVSGRTRFVSLSGNNANSGLNSAAPKRTVLNAVTNSAAGGGDIVLLRPGNYNEQITLDRPVTLRATRNGWGTIGKP
jgi:hypothetical protein